MSVEHEMTPRRKRSFMESVYWGAVLLWAGLVFGADSLGYLPKFGKADAWSWAFAGAGIIGLIGALYRLVSTDLPKPNAWDYIWSGGLTILGLVGFTGLDIGFPLILLLIGVVLLGSAIIGRG